MESMRIPGVALAVVQGDKVIYAKGYGAADATGRPVTPETPFILGSVSKSFTALAVMQLAGQGKVDLDAPVQRYVPAVPAPQAGITVRQLLNQVSGIPTAAGQAQLMGDESSTMEQVMAAEAGRSLSAVPGQTFQYSNYNYTLLGLVVENASGRKYEHYVEEQIFQPLGMRHSHTTQRAAAADGLAAGYRVWFGLPLQANLPYPQGSLPGGYLIASVEDMAHYLIAHLNAGRYGAATILSVQGMDELHRGVAPVPGGGRYAMGWFEEDLNGIPTLWHGGDVPNYHADMVLVPGEKLGIVMLSNRNTPGYSALLAKRVAADLTSVLVKGAAPRRTFTLTTFYVMVDVVSLLLIGWQVWNLLRLKRRTGPRWLRLTRGYLSAGIALLILVGMPLSGGVTWASMFRFHPDLTIVIAVACVLALVTGVGRLLPARAK